MKPHAIVFDLDGVIANLNHRLHWVQRMVSDGWVGALPFEPNWDAFFSPIEIIKDEVIVPTRVIINALSRTNVRSLIVTAREQRLFEVTEDWLMRWNVHYDRLYLRPDGDHKLHSAAEWKRDFVSHLMDEWAILGFYDDSQANVEAVSKLGVPSFLYCEGPEPRKSGHLQTTDTRTESRAWEELMLCPDCEQPLDNTLRHCPATGLLCDDNGIERVKEQDDDA